MRSAIKSRCSGGSIISSICTIRTRPDFWRPGSASSAASASRATACNSAIDGDQIMTTVAPLMDLLAGQLGDIEAGWSVGTFGAIAEFTRDAGETAELHQA